jgi:hypothetical protein
MDGSRSNWTEGTVIAVPPVRFGGRITRYCHRCRLGSRPNLLRSGVELPYRTIKTNIADSLNMIVHIERRPGTRFVSEVIRICGYRPDVDNYDLQSLANLRPKEAKSLNRDKRARTESFLLPLKQIPNRRMSPTVMDRKSAFCLCTLQLAQRAVALGRV